MGTLLISKLRGDYSDKTTATFSVFPSFKISNIALEPYNATLSINRLIEDADLVFCLDNEALYDICFHQLKISSPTYENLNQLIKIALSNITAPLRFPSQGKNCLSTLQNMVDKLIPLNSSSITDGSGFIEHTVDLPSTLTEDDIIPSKFQLRFLNISLAPIITSTNDQSNFLKEVFSKQNIFTSTDPCSREYFSSVAIFRGQITDEMLNRFYMYASLGQMFAHIKGNKHEHIVKLGVPRKGVKTEVALITSHAAIRKMFKRIAEQFTIMFRRKAFLHWYTGEGMDEMEFTEAESNLSDLVTTYQTIEDDLKEGSKSEEETE